MKMTIQEWLEERDIQRRSYAVATWIPLMVNARTLEQGKPGHAGHKKESRSIESLIVPVHNRAAFKSATWHEIIRHNPLEAGNLLHGIVDGEGVVAWNSKDLVYAKLGEACQNIFSNGGSFHRNGARLAAETLGSDILTWRENG